MFIDDLSFDGEYPGVSGDPGAEAAARAFRQWNKLERQRHAREAKLDDIRTATIMKMLNIANRLTELNHDVTNLVLHDDSNGALKLLQQRLMHAEEYSNLLYQDMIKEASHG